jgi:hypothetical protein
MNITNPIRDMILVWAKSHLPVQVGDVCSTGKGDIVTVTGGRAPHTEASTGRVHVRLDGNGVTNEYFPNVVGAKWITMSEYDAHQQGRASHDPD